MVFKVETLGKYLFGYPDKESVIKLNLKQCTNMWESCRYSHKQLCTYSTYIVVFTAFTAFDVAADIAVEMVVFDGTITVSPVNAKLHLKYESH